MRQLWLTSKRNYKL